MDPYQANMPVPPPTTVIPHGGVPVGVPVANATNNQTPGMISVLRVEFLAFLV